MSHHVMKRHVYAIKENQKSCVDSKNCKINSKYSKSYKKMFYIKIHYNSLF